MRKSREEIQEILWREFDNLTDAVFSDTCKNLELEYPGYSREQEEKCNQLVKELAALYADVIEKGYTRDEAVKDEISESFEEDLEKAHEVDVLPESGISEELKVIIENGIVQSVLSNSGREIDVEIVDVDGNYDDYEKLCDYRDALYKNEQLKEIPHTVVDFEEEVFEEMLRDEQKSLQSLEEKIIGVKEKQSKSAGKEGKEIGREEMSL